MALKQIILENFRGKENVTYTFNPNLNTIRGVNGAGKSGIKEAIVYAYCGTDSVGTKNPQHLISKDKENLKVTVITDKSEVSRSLTRKGSTTIKVTKNGASATYTQNQLEQLLGSTDLFLSTFLPGHFMGMDPERQHKVLMEVQPKVDRNALFAELAGFELTPEEKIRYAIQRRVDLVLSAISLDRRQIEKSLNAYEGEIVGLRNISDVPDPGEFSGKQILDNMEVLKKDWDRYEAQLASYSSSLSSYNRHDEECRLRGTVIAGYEGDLAKLQLVPVPAHKQLDIQSIRAELKPVPPLPLVAKVVDTDNCAHCGQVVSVKHRENTRSQNAKGMEEYQAVCNEITAHNSEVQGRIASATQKQTDLDKSFMEANRENEKIGARKRSIELQIQQLQAQQVTREVPVKPSEPAELFAIADYNLLKSNFETYTKRKAEYDFVQKQKLEAETKVAGVQAKIAELSTSLERVQKIEATIQSIPSVEMERQKFELDGIQMVTSGDKVSFFVDTIPFGMLSTGQQMKAGMKFSATLNKYKPMGMMFVENADLIDTVPEVAGMQIFTAIVSNENTEVTIN